MTMLKRIRTVIVSVFIIIAAFIIAVLPVTTGCLIIIGLLSLSLTIYGIKQIVYYFSMARHMVSGQLILYEAIILIDMGIFTGILGTVPEIYIVIYLALYYLVGGVASILSGWEAWKHRGAWKRRVIPGLVCVGIAVMSIIFNKSPEVVVQIYCLGLIYLAVTKIAEAVRPGAIMYFE